MLQSHSGATVARILRVARIVSPTVSSRLRVRIAPSTCVESVRCFPRSFNHPCFCATLRTGCKICGSISPSNRRARNSHRTEASKPGSVSSKLSIYFQSIRPRTASAACRSESPSANCIKLMSSNRQGASAGCPQFGNKRANE